MLSGISESSELFSKHMPGALAMKEKQALVQRLWIQLKQFVQDSQINLHQHIILKCPSGSHFLHVHVPSSPPLLVLLLLYSTGMNELFTG